VRESQLCGAATALYIAVAKMIGARTVEKAASLLLLYSAATLVL
jgi:hypothetical protein